MSSIPPVRDSDTQPISRIGTGERKRAALVLGVLAVVAVLVVGVLGYVLGSSDDPGPSTPAAAPTGPDVQVTGGRTPSATPTAATSRTTAAPASTTPVAVPTGAVSCPTSARCIVAGDVGGAVAAVNAYRAANGRVAVTGKVSATAQKCALQSGDGPACPSGYYWEPVGRSGAQVVGKIAGKARGKSYLLDKAMTVLQVGWVYVPSTKSFECVVVSNA